MIFDRNEYLTAREFAKKFNTSAQLVVHHVKIGSIEGFLMDDRYYIPISELEKWKERPTKVGRPRVKGDKN